MRPCQRFYDEFVYSTREEVDELYPKAQRFIEEVDALLAKYEYWYRTPFLLAYCMALPILSLLI